MAVDKKKLNEEQKQAVIYKNGPLLIIAGAGTGKTTVITERVKHLILKRNVKATQILALTFTEKAAREMEERIDKVLPYGYTQMWVMTFHSFCDRILRREALHIGLDPRYKLATEAETVQFIRRNLFKFELKYFRPLGNPTRFISAMLQHFSRLQDEDITPVEYLQWAKDQIGSLNDESIQEEKQEAEKWLELAKAYQTYEDLKTKEGILDFGNLITKTLKLFRERTNVLKEYQEQFKYVLVDEFQDTNYAQNQLAMLLAGDGKNITACGDDDQSIYRFRGAAVSNILQFKKIYPEAKTVVLTKNYRSAQQILDSSYSLVQFNNPERLEVKEKIVKRLVSQTKNEGEVIFIHKNRVENEADAVAKKITELITQQPKGNYTYKDFAVLVRANNHSEPFIKAFQRLGIPYQFLGPGRLFKQPEIIDLIAFLKVINNFEDSASLYRVLSIAEFDISLKEIIKLTNHSRYNNLSLFETCEHIDQVFVTEDTKVKVGKIITVLNAHIEKMNKETAGQLLYGMLSESGLLQKLFNPDTPEAEKKATNISKFFDKIKTYEVDHEDAGITAVVDWIDLCSELGESPLAADSDWADVNAVNILTVHSAKGLEFPVVFIVNLVSQRFPTIEKHEPIPLPEALIKEMLPQGDFHLQEERRLFYVGLTRAKEKLFLTAANYYGEGKREKKLSQFIYETLGDNVISSEKETETGEQLSFLDYKPSGVILLKNKDEQHNLHVDFLSYSQIDTYNTCPLHYKLKYVLGISPPKTSALSFGDSMHKTLNDFYSAIQKGETGDIKMLYKALDQNWSHEGYMDKSHEKEMLDQGRRFLAEYIDHEFDQNNIPVALEQRFTVPLFYPGGRGIRIGGKIDRVDILKDKRIEIIDYKTGANIPTQNEIDNNLQMTFYALAAVNMQEPPFNRKPEEVILSFYYFDTQTKITTIRTAEQLKAATREIFEWRERIEASDFKCSAGYLCQNGCEYSLFCSAEI